MELRDICSKELDTLWEEHRRLINPSEMYVDLSDKLYDIKKNLLHQMSMDDDRWALILPLISLQIYKKTDISAS